MKTLFYFLMPLFAICFSNCASSTNATNKEKTTNPSDTIQNPDENLDLTDHLRTFSGVQITGSGRNATITIRGHSSISLSTEPLFVVNGNTLGGGLRQAYDMVDVENIKSIRVLKGASQTARYGVRGSNGVVEIVLKTY